MSFRSIVRDVRDGFGSLSRRRSEAVLSGHHKDKSHSLAPESDDRGLTEQNSCWAALPLELLRDVIKRLEESESSWPSRRNVVTCASVCRAWRQTCKEIVEAPEFSGKLTFPASLKQPGSRSGHIQCCIRRDELRSTYHLYLCLSPALFVEKGKFLLSAKRIQRSTYREYIISMDADNISKHSPSFMGKLRSNYVGDTFLIYDTQPPYYGAGAAPPAPSHFRRRFYCKKVSPKFPFGNYNIAEVTYEMNVHGAHSPRRMNCTMYSIPASSVYPAGRPQEDTSVDPLEDSFRSMSFSNSCIDLSTDSSSSSRHSIIAGAATPRDDERKNKPLVLRSKNPRWHEQLQCWCLNFHGRVTVASVKNFQLIAATQHAIGGVPAVPGPMDHEKVILQFGKVGKDAFTMDYRYPLSAFQAFAICLSSLDNKIGRE